MFFVQILFSISMFRFSTLYLCLDSLLYIYVQIVSIFIYVQILYSISMFRFSIYVQILYSISMFRFSTLYLCSDSLLYISMFRFSISMFRFSTLYLYVVCISRLSSNISRFTTCISRYGDIWVYPRTEECN